LAAYAKKDTLALIATGTQGLDELLTKVEEDNVNFGLVRVTEVIDKSKTTKICVFKMATGLC